MFGQATSSPRLITKGKKPDTFAGLAWLFSKGAGRYADAIEQLAVLGST
jgi:hypothetical protein